MLCAFVFFKQKTAYEMRISDWSSDVCSSDLSLHHTQYAFREGNIKRPGLPVAAHSIALPQGGHHAESRIKSGDRVADADSYTNRRKEIGRASCRESVCTYVWISVVSGSFKNKEIDN